MEDFWSSLYMKVVCTNNDFGIIEYQTLTEYGFGLVRCCPIEISKLN